jgi:hypothetical protein
MEEKNHVFLLHRCNERLGGKAMDQEFTRREWMKGQKYWNTGIME